MGLVLLMNRRLEQYIELHYKHTGEGPLPLHQLRERYYPDPFKHSARIAQERLNLVFTRQQDPALETARKHIIRFGAMVLLFDVLLGILAMTVALVSKQWELV